MDSGSDWSGVTAAITRAEATGAVLGVALAGPAGRFAHNGGRRFVAASTVKIPIMVELFRQVESGRCSLATRHVLQEADKAPGGGIVKHLGPGVGFSLHDLAVLMMSISDNSATNILIDRLGMDAVNATMADLGMDGSTLGRPMRGRGVQPGESENWATPDDYLAAMAALMEDRAAAPASCAAMRALLETQANDRRIARHLPRDGRPRWGSKTGSLPGVVNDVGFIETPHGTLLLALFCEAPPDPHAGEAMLGDIAAAAFAAAG